MIPGSFFEVGAWRDFKNVSGETIPAFGIGIITDISADGEDDTVYREVDKCSSYGDVFGNCVINGPADVEADHYGRCSRADEVLALYDSADGPPAALEFWGPRDDTWKLKKNTPGFLCLGAPTNTTRTIAIFRPVFPTFILVKNDSGSSWAKGSTYDMNIYAGATQGSEAALGGSSVLEDVYVRLGAVANGKWAYVGFVNGRLEIVTAEC